MATIQISSKDLQDLLGTFKAEEDWQLERLEDVETLTDIIREYRVNRARSDEIASAIIRFVKKGEG
jgi:tRNA(Ser,Leu) C12 N-acetylase TAN1